MISFEFLVLSVIINVIYRLLLKKIKIKSGMRSEIDTVPDMAQCPYSA